MRSGWSVPSGGIADPSARALLGYGVLRRILTYVASVARGALRFSPLLPEEAEELCFFRVSILSYNRF